MIKINNLTKIYKAKAKTLCRAIDGIDLTLPERGLIFVLGKSGSGKSTLLNLIGGLDSFDCGDIVSFGHSLKGFSESQLEAYRSDFVSFVFQDYHLIDELTVLENVTLFNSDNIDEELLASTLETVGMTDYVSRYPRELSGGQKQRVAIARGIMKNPKVILCDEPTGNLDRKTSRQILELLKRLSRDKLVLVVSHNLSEAEAFADRIIELSDGRVLEDRTLDPEYVDGFSIEDGVARLPYHERMTDSEVGLLNEALRDGRVTSIQPRESGFVNTDIEYKEEKKELTLRKLGRKNILRLFRKFFFSKYRSAISTILISVIMFSVFAVIQSFTRFDAIASLKDGMGEEGSVLVIERDYPSFPRNIYDDMSFLDGRETYPFYSQTIWLDNSYASSWDNVTRMTDEKNFSELYIHESYGLLLCDDGYLLDLWGRDGEIPLVAGDLDGARTTGLLITDYFADSIISHEIAAERIKYLTYDSLIGVFIPASVNSACRIAGIIDTDYEERYKVIFDRFNEIKESQEEPLATEIKKLLTEDPTYVRFVDDVMVNLGIAYSLNPDYINSFDLTETSLVRFAGFYYEAEGNEFTLPSVGFVSTLSRPLGADHVGEGEIGLPYELFNKLYGTEYTASDANKLDHIEKKTVTLKRYIDDDPKKGLLYEMDFTVTLLTNSRPIISREGMLAIKRADWQPSRIYMKGDVDVGAVLDFIEENDYHIVSREKKNIQRLDELISAFKDLFTMLEVTIILLISIYLIYFGIRSIRQNSYQIGVIKALGGRGRDVGKIFVLKTFIIGTVISLLSALISTLFIRMANVVLVASIEEVIGMRINELSVINVIPGLLLSDALIMIGIAFISALLPTVMLKGIKPVEIIKAKE
ncbi:MAG: ABC transporter ATP-binding protein/permease [Clostridia bacterium]|nr:ABC transporter ATP-binding protein/permease [Clostridia bacterium]